MILKTKDYDKFVFRKDNRASIDKTHVNRLISSIKSRNLLELNPIIVNERYEILDGQHRVKAAQALDTEIYYEVRKELEDRDIIIMNVTKNWTIEDYLNYYCVHEYPNYIKFRKFIESHSIGLRVGLSIFMGWTNQCYDEFKNGQFIYDGKVIEPSMGLCQDTIAVIRKTNGFSPYTVTARFWKALVKLIGNEKFDPEKWMVNVKKLADRFSSRSGQRGYYKMLVDIYNWHNSPKIEVHELEN
jgi:hypothetical protein